MVMVSWLLACGSAPVGPAEVEGATPFPLDDARLDETWVIEVVPEAAVAQFASEPGWVTLVLKRDLKGAVAQLGPVGGLAAARAHVEAAALYWQAARLAGESYVQTYAGPSAQPTDPAGVAHLVSVGRGLAGDLAAARSSSAEARSLSDDPTTPWHAPWAAWLARGTWPPDLAALPLELPDPSVGGWPEIGPMPQYELAERSGQRSRRPVGDPLALVALGQWHAEAARLASPDQAVLLRRLRHAYRIPADATGAGEASEVPLALRFGGDALTSADVDLLVEVRDASSPEVVVRAVRRLRERSVVAALADAALVERSLDPSRASDLAEDLRKALIARAAALREGPEQPQDVQFAQMAKIAVLRSLGMVAEALGDREGAGRLLIAAWDAGEGVTADPVGRLWFATWDVANRYPVRAAQTIHQESRRIPSLNAARLAVDVLNLRVNRENVGQGPN